ncbi:MAG: alpha-E domain-containing protein [Nesterenkonia sp.]|uniref:alpha-E domain-containing protein n=1 Tax=Nesterenkonia marinintestina TaxID=2979865 RepID=UPI0021BFF447|nr:alpha-E domain-containing protein [Nesterenkonia sp. GX14115]MDO5492120.1 alpha-E domain-containing protein [Nesterenkonia sp.]
MLSRIAESLFWIGRYVERADGTARILDVHLERLNQLTAEERATVSDNLMAVMGADPEEDRDEGDGLREVLHRLAFDRGRTSSIAGSLGAARENARRARETVSSSVWEALNTTWNGLSGHRQDVVGTYRLCTWVVERTATVRGMADSTMSRDDSWQFLSLGRCLERADMTARMLATGDEQSFRLSWANMLRCAGAYESFLRSRPAGFDESSAAEFLLLDGLFPRSIVSSLRGAEKSLISLDPVPSRLGHMDASLRIIGQARSFLEFHHTEDLLGELPEHLDRVRSACAEASDAITSKYFSHDVAQAWTGELI